MRDERSSGRSDRDPHWDLVERVGESAFPQRSSRLRDLMFYICECSLQNRHEDLREQSIGQVVFGRGPEFRPSEDNIVRVEAARLRKRLAEHFAGAGLAEPIVITIPKGAYIACFEPRAAGQVEYQDAECGGESMPTVEAASGPPRSWTALKLGLALLGIAACGLILWRSTWPARQGESRTGAATTAPRLLWSGLFDQQHQTYVVCADTSLLIFQEFAGVPVLMRDYINRSFWSKAPKMAPDTERALRALMTRHFTGIYDLRVAEAILQLNSDFRDRALIQSARDVDPGSFKNSNFVLLGARKANPWVELFEQNLNFQFVFDLSTRRSGYRNLRPQPGEQSAYWVDSEPLQVNSTYSLIAFVPNMRRNGNVLLVGGTTGEGTEAAGMLATNPRLLEAVLRQMHALQNGTVQYFEALLKSEVTAGVSKNAEVVAYRLLRFEK